METRKYISEFGLAMSAEYIALVQQDTISHLNKIEEAKNHPFHIYMIGRRPRITLDPEYFEATDQTIKVCFQIQRKHTFERHKIEAHNELGTKDLRLECPYPHTEFIIYNQQGHRLLEGKTAVLAQYTPQLHNLVSLEILYIGQSYGVEGARTAQQRLRNHSTLQMIYAEAMRRSPDQEIWIVLLSFEEILIALFDGTGDIYEKSNEEDNEHIDQVLYTKVTEQQRINFMEAALIRYFEPEYNKLLKNSFPNPAHSTYSQCYDLDLNAVSVWIDTSAIVCPIGSAKVPAKWEHFIQFPLHSPEERRNMFDFVLRTAKSGKKHKRHKHS